MTGENTKQENSDGGVRSKLGAYWIKGFIGFSILAALMVYALTRMDLAAAFTALKKIRLVWIIPFAITFYLGYYLRALRWGYLLEGTVYVPLPTLFTSIAVGSMFNMLLPFKSGEVVRAYILKIKNDVSYSHSISSIALDRIYDTLPIFPSLSCLLFTLGVQKVISGGGNSIATISTVAIGAIVVCAAIAAAYFSPFKGGLVDNDKITGIVATWRKFVVDFRMVAAGQNIYKVLSYSFGIWLVYLSQYACYFLLAGYTPTFMGVNLLLCFTSLGILISAMPANIGTYHAAVIIAFGLCGIPAAVALGAAVFIHLLLFLLAVGMGLFLLWKEGIRLKEVRGFVTKSG